MSISNPTKDEVQNAIATVAAKVWNNWEQVLLSVDNRPKQLEMLAVEIFVRNIEKDYDNFDLSVAIGTIRGALNTLNEKGYLD